MLLNAELSQRASASLAVTLRGMGSNPHSAAETLGRWFHCLGPQLPHLYMEEGNRQKHSTIEGAWSLAFYQLREGKRRINLTQQINSQVGRECGF